MGEDNPRQMESRICYIGCVALVFLVFTVGQHFNIQYLNFTKTEGTLLRDIKLKMATESQLERLTRIQNWCKENKNGTGYTQQKGLQRCIANKERKILFCPIAKAASTTWKMMMFMSTEKAQKLFSNFSHAVQELSKGKPKALHTWKTQEEFGLEQFNGCTDEEILRKSKDYFKFLFVRHPYQRLLSAYKNKLRGEGSSYFMRTIGKQIVNLRNSKGMPEPSKMNITFQESLKYVINQLETGSALDRHWAPIVTVVNPCLMNFDFIGKLETISEDAPVYIKHLFGGRRDSTLPNCNPTSGDFSEGYYFDAVDYDTKKKLKSFYADDFKLFGYDPNAYG